MSCSESREWRATASTEWKIFGPIIAISLLGALRYGIDRSLHFQLTLMSGFMIVSAVFMTVILLVSIWSSSILVADPSGFSITSWRGKYHCRWTELEPFKVIPSPTRDAQLIGITFAYSAKKRHNWSTRYTRRTMGCDRCRTNEWDISTYKLVDILNAYLIEAKAVPPK